MFSKRLFMTSLLVSTLVSCSTTHERRDPTGERFPQVEGHSLDSQQVAIPGQFAGTPTLLIVGYQMESQFDIDRWLLGLRDAGVDVPVYELPTIPGMIPGMFAGTIDAGMRSGIPEEDWAIVVTLYEHASTVAQFLGNENPLPARVILLDATGRVAFFHDRGYSVTSLSRLEAALAQLTDGVKQ